MKNLSQLDAFDISLPESDINLEEYLKLEVLAPFFVEGSAEAALASLPSGSVDMVMTSPPYWGQREYGVPGIGNEQTPEAYTAALVDIGKLIRRALKPTGSFWLNIGDTYRGKTLCGLPWRIAIKLMDECGFILRNDVIWHKVKGGMDQSQDKLRNVHEHLFHFVVQTKYYYDADVLRSPPKQARNTDGRIISATGVSGVRYLKQIESSDVLSSREKNSALLALQLELAKVGAGAIADFRMIIRGQQRATHSDQESVSGRAKELNERGYYFLRYHPNGAKMGDVWDILPEDTKRQHGHYAAYPENLCRRPISATCPKAGLVVDPFCGTGTTMRVAYDLGRRSIGIDLSPEFLAVARERCRL